MAFCPNCGASVEGKFCANCGTAMGPAAAGVGSGYQAGAAPGAQYSSSAGLTENVAAALCYVVGLITGIVFLVLAPYNQNKNIRFHAFQSIFTHCAVIALFIVEGILGMILPWALSAMLSLVGMLIALGVVGLWVVLIVKAYQGQRFKVPVIGDLAEKQA